MQKNFSYPIKIDDLKQSDYKYELNADIAELEDITQILQVEKVHEFKAEIFLKLNKITFLLCGSVVKFISFL